MFESPFDINFYTSIMPVEVSPLHSRQLSVIIEERSSSQEWESPRHQQIKMRTRRVLLGVISFDIFCLICSFILFIYAMLGLISQGQFFDPRFNRTQLMYVCAMIAGYGSISILCNCLAYYGIKKGRGCLLIPYLIFIPLVITFLFISSITIGFIKGVNEFLSPFLGLPVVISLVLSYMWGRLVKQWSIMAHTNTDSRDELLEGDTASALETIGLPSRDELFESDIDIASSLEAIGLPTRQYSEANNGEYNDPPPRYESLQVESCPPCYDEVIFGKVYSE